MKLIHLRPANINLKEGPPGKYTAYFSSFISGYPTLEVPVSARGAPPPASATISEFSPFLYDALKVYERGVPINGYDPAEADFHAADPAGGNISLSFPVVNFGIHAENITKDDGSVRGRIIHSTGRGCINPTYTPALARTNFSFTGAVFELETELTPISGDGYLYAYVSSGRLYISTITVIDENTVIAYENYWAGDLNDVELYDAPTTPESLVIDPTVQYFYKEIKQTLESEYSDRYQLFIQNSDGSTRALYLREYSDIVVEYTNKEEIYSLSFERVSGSSEFVYRIKYKRADIVTKPWSVTLSLNGMSVTIEYKPISTIGNTYTPGTGGGVISGIAGGGGNFGVINGTPEFSDNVVNSLPGIGTPSGSYEGSVSNAGLFVHYAMDANMLKVVGDWLWATDLGLIVAKEVMSILYGSPIESAISLMSYPFNVTMLPGVVTRTQNMFWGSHEIGGLSGGVSATAITNPYATIDWGTVQLTEFWGNFLDYAPHTKLELYLPWCTGFVPIDPNECLPGSLRVVTNIELAKGTCLHNVIGNDGRVIATHSGTCGKQLPLTALDTSGKALSLVSGATMAAIVGGGAIAGGTAGAMYGGFDVVKLQGPGGQRYVPYNKPGSISSALEGAKFGAGMYAKASKKPAVMAAAAGLRANVSVPRNGTFTGSTAGLGVQYPYLIISRPTQSVPAQYGHHYGYPSNIYAPLANIRGYTEIGEIHLNGFTCTDDELSEIDSLLKSGVIL